MPDSQGLNRQRWDEKLAALEAVRLRDANLQGGVVTPKWATDALHVALASVERCRCIVSWNFRHIVHFDKIPLYHGIDLINGLGSTPSNRSMPRNPTPSR